MFYQILKGVYTSNLFETCFMVANDDLKGKTTHFTGFYTNSKNLKTCHWCYAKRCNSHGHLKYIKKNIFC